MSEWESVCVCVQTVVLLCEWEGVCEQAVVLLCELMRGCIDADGDKYRSQSVGANLC